MDFSSKALDHCRRVFERESLTAHFLQGDIRDPGVPAFDLVFNAGVLEHYTLEEQADLLRCMASRSRRYVLVLVPNALCYWYWIRRVHQAYGRAYQMPNSTAHNETCASVASGTLLLR